MPKTCDVCEQTKDNKHFQGSTCYICVAAEETKQLAIEVQNRKDDKQVRKLEKKQTKERVARKAYVKKKARAKKKEVSALQKELATRALAKRKLIHFIKRFQPKYEDGWVHHDICRRLERFMRAIEAGESPRLMLFMPPRHGKSLIASDYFPSWLLGHNPDFEVIASSYAVSLPIGFSRKVRGRIKDPAYKAMFPDTALDPESTAAEQWNTTRSGGYVAAGVGGGITGKGAHCAYFKMTATTPHGNIPISQICVGDEVLGYDHETKKPVWTEVRAISTQYREKLISVNGACVTPDHRVWTEKGYIEAQYAEDSRVKMSSLWEGVPQNSEGPQTEFAAIWRQCKDILFISVRQPAQHEAIVRLRQQESSACPNLSGMLFERQTRSAVLRAMWQRVRAACSRAFQEQTAAWRGLQELLQQRVLQHIPRTTSGRPHNNRALSDVSEGSFWQEGILQYRLLPEPCEGEEGSVLRHLEQAETGSCSTRRTSVRKLRERERQDGSAPHRPRLDEPRYEQPDSAVRALSQPLSSAMPGICAEDFAEVLRGQGGYRVVDLQTDTQNFFCEGVLVHNCLIIDDPIKDAQEADSETIRESNWDWYGSTAYTRLSPGGGILIIQTRWHDDDLSGRLIEQMKKLREEEVPEEEIDNWEIVSYPAEATGDEYITRGGRIVDVHEKYASLLRHKGDPLHEERFPTKRLRRIKRSLQPRHWSALYQQNPVPDEGVFFTKDMFRLTPSLPKLADMKLFMAWDLAVGERQTNDYSVGVVGGLDYDDQLYIIDVVRARMNTHDCADAILNMYKKYNVFSPVTIGIERGQLELSMKPTLKKMQKERRLYPTYDSTLVPITDKTIRARPLQGRMQQGMVYLPATASWLEIVQHEMLRFPGGVHDDVVDAMAWLARMAIAAEPPQPPKEKRRKSWRDNLKGHIAGGASKAPMAQ